MLEPEFAIAILMHAIRDDWSVTACRERVVKALERRSIADTAIAAVMVAADPKSGSPGRLLYEGPWWHGAIQPKFEPATQPKPYKRGPIDRADPEVAHRHAEQIRADLARRHRDGEEES